MNQLLRTTAWALATLASVPATWAAPLHVKVVDAQGQPLSDAAVSVLVKGSAARAGTDARAEMGQKNRSFQPGVLVIQTGTAVSFPNYDTVRHHIYSFSSIKPFEIKLYAGTPAAPMVFDKPGTAVLGCNIHDQMSAVIHVVDTPYFGKTDAQGQLTLNVPVGEHRLQAWHTVLTADSPPVGQPVKVGADGGSATVALAPPKPGN